MANFATKVAQIGSKWAILVKFQRKLKYLSEILTDLHLTFRKGLVLLSRSKWVQGVLCYNQNWWKLKYLSRILTNLHRTSKTGLIFLSQSKWLQGVLCYDQKFNFGHAKSAINIFSLDFQLFIWVGAHQTLVMPNLP